MANLLILGAGGFGQVIKELAMASGEYSQIAFLDDNSTAENVVGKCGDYKMFKDRFDFAFPAFGNNPLRVQWIESLQKAGFIVPKIIHQSAYISPSVKMGKGCAVLPNAVINTQCVLGKGVLINCGAVVDHNCRLEDGVHICLNAVVKANCKLEKMIKLEAGEVLKNWE